MSMTKACHDMLIEISYDPCHKIYEYLKYIVNSSRFFRIHTLLSISSNIHMRYDVTIHILSGLLLINDVRSILLSNLHYVEQSESFKKCKKNTLINHFKTDVKLMKYVKPSKKFINIVMKLINKYDQNDNISDIINYLINIYCDLITLFIRETEFFDAVLFSAQLYFVGLIEWFHLIIFRHILINQSELLFGTNIFLQNNNNNGECLIFFGQFIQIDTSAMCEYSRNDIKKFLTKEYPSHSTVNMFGSFKNHNQIDGKNPCSMVLFDPDHETDFDKSNQMYDRFAEFMNIQNCSKYFKPNMSIQKITDDIYCIFHCIKTILMFTESYESFTIDNVKNMFMKISVDNKKITKRDMQKFILSLNITV